MIDHSHRFQFRQETLPPVIAVINERKYQIRLGSFLSVNELNQVSLRHLVADDGSVLVESEFWKSAVEPEADPAE
jgi:hypothetical protein